MHQSRLLPSRFRSLASIVIVVHLGLFAATLSTAVIDWRLRDRLVDIATPYTAAIHLDLGGRALGDARHTMADWRHRFQYSDLSGQSWEDYGMPTRFSFGGSQRFQRFLVLLAEAAEQEDMATAAMLAEPLVERLDQAEFRQGFRVRVVADMMELENDRDKLTPSVRWEAGVVSKPNLTEPAITGLALVYLEEPRLNSKAVSKEVQ